MKLLRKVDYFYDAKRSISSGTVIASEAPPSSTEGCLYLWREAKQSLSEQNWLQGVDDFIQPSQF
jgi:hypothetical protein